MPVYTKDTTCHLLSRVRREHQITKEYGVLLEQHYITHRSHYMAHSLQLVLLNLRLNLRASDLCSPKWGNGEGFELESQG